MPNHNVMVPTVRIPEEEYEQLKKDSGLLNALRSAGVDNWEGWDYAIEMLEKED